LGFGFLVVYGDVWWAFLLGVGLMLGYFGLCVWGLFVCFWCLGLGVLVIGLVVIGGWCVVVFLVVCLMSFLWLGFFFGLVAWWGFFFC